MRSVDILVFMIAFNFCLNTVILIMGDAAPPGQDMDFSTKIDVEGGIESNTSLIGALVLGIIAASVTVIGTEATKPIAVVVGAFGGFYGWTLASAMSTLYNFHIGAVPLVPLSIIGILVFFNVTVFVFGIMQLVSGGWRSAE